MPPIAQEVSIPETTVMERKLMLVNGESCELSDVEAPFSAAKLIDL